MNYYYDIEWQQNMHIEAKQIETYLAWSLNIVKTFYLWLVLVSIVHNFGISAILQQKNSKHLLL